PRDAKPRNWVRLERSGQPIQSVGMPNATRRAPGQGPAGLLPPWVPWGPGVLSPLGLPAAGRSAMKAVSAAASRVRAFSGVGLQALLIAAIVVATLLALAPVFNPAEDFVGID